MQAKFIVLSLFFLVNNVLCGGYSGALDRVWLFYAYEIDGLRDPGDQVLGWKCMQWDKQQKKCKQSNRGKNGWVMCMGTAPRGRCTFSELLSFLGEARSTDRLLADSTGKLLPLQDTNPDPQETAKKVYTHLLSTKGNIRDWPGYRIILNGGEGYLRSIRQVASAVKNAEIEGKSTAANKQFFQRFADTTTQIKNSRVGDTGRFVITEAKDYLNTHGLNSNAVATESIVPGRNPVNPALTWETVDWAKTESNLATSLGNQQAQTTLKSMKGTIYSHGSVTNTHEVVIKAFRTAETTANGCI
ncbi:hypothetical protein F4678DRAFT_482763 [Xylaria arbuscula]|nr:hypothetical protein F4678DRAFT_482763 [Xylaria arbuscula]